MPAVQQTVVPKTFGATSTTDEVLEGFDLKGKRVLVTGVSAGLGVETARALVAHGADVVGAARDLAKAKRATAGVNAVGRNSGEFELVELDLASLDSVRAAPMCLPTTAIRSTSSSPRRCGRKARRCWASGSERRPEVNPSSRGAIGHGKTPSFDGLWRRGDQESRAPYVPLDCFASLAMTAG